MNQPGKKLFYFLTKDSLLGVKDENGKIIIEPMEDYRNWSNKALTTPIKENLIFIDYPVQHEPVPLWGSVYNRKGEFLYNPAAYDNGADPYIEGYQRFVKNNKMGFANRNGDIVIDAVHDYVANFNYGTAAFCDGCTWVTNREHRIVKGGKWGYMNYKGETVTVTDKRASISDQVIDSAHFLPNQFAYSAFEQKIIDSFYKLTAISKTYFVNYYSPFEESEKMIYYQIVERPSSSYPYYHIGGFTYTVNGGYDGSPFDKLNFYVSRDGKSYFCFDYNNKKVPLSKWLKKEIKEAKQYVKKHPDAPNRF